jgi:hypothetical protein
MEPQRERRHDAEVAAPAAERPEQVRVLILARGDDAAVRQHDLRGQQVVDREPVLAGEIPVPSAERQPAHPGRRDDPRGRRKPERVGGAVEIGQQRSTLDRRRPSAGIDADLPHPAQIDHEPLVHGAEPRAVVASAADRDVEAALASELERGGDVRHAGTARHHGRPSIDHRVVEATRLLVAPILRRHHLAAQLRAELVDARFAQSETHDLFPFRSSRSRGDQ